jgi:2-polyprenyl-6-methoxyphenol hydroxylase-like FAD-dependent oxidoreductase
MNTDSPFKAIVIGGGPVGLAAARTLSKAGIDFEILERRSTIVIETGSDLVMLPIGLRILNQLGLYERVQGVSAPLGELQRLDHHGRDIGSSRLLLQLGVK